MAIERAASNGSLIEVLDRVLDKGIVIDSWMRVALAGLNLLELEGRIVVAYISTYLTRTDEIGLVLSPPILVKPEVKPKVKQPITETVRQVRRKSSSRRNRIA